MDHIITEERYKRSLAALTIDGTDKGLPLDLSPVSPEGFVKQKKHLFRDEFPMPVMVVKEEILDNNIRWMEQYQKKCGISLAPHGKTTMTPQLFYRQLKDSSCWGLTLATVHQVKTARDFGFNRILLANSLMGNRETDFILKALSEDSSFQFYCLVDSLENADFLLNKVGKYELKSPLNILIEVGVQNSRSGCRTIDEVISLSRFLRKGAPGLRVVGIEGYEGAINAASFEEKEKKVADFMDLVVEAAVALDGEVDIEETPIILSAGGTFFFDIAGEKLTKAGSHFPGKEISVIIRSGCYVTHDDGIYETGFEALKKRSSIAASIPFDLKPAVEVWGHLLSRPEETMGVVQIGCRDVSVDSGLPKPLYLCREGEHSPEPLTGCSLYKMNDQHGFLKIPADCDIRPGDRIGFGISHPCLTFDKWRTILVVDKGYNVKEIVKTFF